MDVPLEVAAAAFRQIESSGNYSALGPVISNGGRYNGDRAYGAYQVMGRNVGDWTQQALGRRLTPQEFLASSSAQDKVFADQYTRNIQRYGNAADAASVWHSGQPLAAARRRGATDGYSTTEDYVNRFNRLVGNPDTISSRARAGAGGSQVEMPNLDGESQRTPDVFETAQTMQRENFVQTLNNLRQQADVTSQRRNSIQTPQAPASRAASVQRLQGTTV